MADVKDTMSKLNKEKSAKLSKYIDGLKEKLKSGYVGSKYENNAGEYTKWLQREIKTHESRLELLNR